MNLLLIDDDPIFQSKVKKAIIGRGFSIVESNKRERIVEIFKNQKLCNYG